MINQAASSLNTATSAGPSSSEKWFISQDGSLSRIQQNGSQEVQQGQPMYVTKEGKLTTEAIGNAPTDLATEVAISKEFQTKDAAFLQSLQNKDYNAVHDFMTTIWKDIVTYKGQVPNRNMTQRQLIELSVRAKYNAARTGGYSPVTMSQPGTPINGTGPATNASSSPVTGKSFTKEQMLAELKKQYSNLDSFDNNKADTVDASLVKANTIGVEFKYPWVAYKLWKTKTMAAELKELKSAEDQVGFILTMSQKRYGGKMLARPVKNLLRHIKSNYEGDPAKLNDKLNAQYDIYFKPRIALLKSTGRVDDLEAAKSLESCFDNLMTRYGLEKAEKFASLSRKKSQ